MPRFRKKPIIIEAFHLTEEARWDNRDWLEWMHRAWNGRIPEPGSMAPGLEGSLLIYTSEGTLSAKIGDWILQGTQGEISTCKDDIFQKLYEQV